MRQKGKKLVFLNQGWVKSFPLRLGLWEGSPGKERSCRPVPGAVEWTPSERI